jgi:hypothetical protein
LRPIIIETHHEFYSGKKLSDETLPPSACGREISGYSFSMSSRMSKV